MKTSDTGFRTIIIQDDLIFTSDTCKDPISKEGYFLGFWVNVKTLGGHYSTNTRVSQIEGWRHWLRHRD